MTNFDREYEPGTQATAGAVPSAKSTGVVAYTDAAACRSGYGKADTIRCPNWRGGRAAQKRNIIRLIIIICLLCLILQAFPLSAQAQTEAVYRIGRFSFENGGEIADMKVGYVTWGKLNDAKDNAILLLPGSSNGRHFADAHIGPGKTYDTDKYFVICVDPIGGGNSSSPQDGLGIGLPDNTPSAIWCAPSM